MNLVQLPVFAPATPEIFLACAGMVLLMVGVFRKTEATGLVSAGTILSFLVAGVLVLFYTGDDKSTAFYGMFISSSFTDFSKILILVGSVLAIVLSNDYMRIEDSQRFEFPILVLFDHHL